MLSPVPDYHRKSMGLEAQCTVRVGRKMASGNALLEAEALVFRGDFRLLIPFDKIKDVAIDGETLIVRTDEQEVRFELGAAAAERWLRKIREPKGLLEKLELGPQSRVAVVDVPDAPFLAALRENTSSIAEGRVPEGAQIIFFGAEAREALRKIPLLRARMAHNGALWVIRPKGSKAISEADVLETLRGAGLVDTKVVAFSRTHTAHKSVIPLELRGKAMPRRPVLSLPPDGPSEGGAKKKSAAPSRSDGPRKAAKKSGAARKRG
ncbi:MAG TPA: hypothetical protein VGY54_03415 [Polyangiaceae bacterium]|nr:hypothetical protein [Polyangiaceae bacterium]